ncbi:unnamed protein product [Absidia cylindrospora]
MSIYDNLPTLNSWYCQEQPSLSCNSQPIECPVVAIKKNRCSHNRNVSFASDPPQVHYLANSSTKIPLSPVSESNSKMKSRLKRYASKLSNKH